MTNLALNLIEAARMYADRSAVRLDDYVLAYTALDEASARLAQLLRGRGMAPVTGWHHAAKRAGDRRPRAVINEAPERSPPRRAQSWRSVAGCERAAEFASLVVPAL